jgi:hypothetical protein
MGGHVMGAAQLRVARTRHGGDHLYGIEVVVVDESGTARRVVATRDHPTRTVSFGGRARARAVATSAS